MSGSDEQERQLRMELMTVQIDSGRLDIEKVRQDMERAREESRKFTAEVHKLMREAEKYRAEEMKLWRDWRLTPWLIAASLVSAVIGGLIARAHF